MVKFQTRVMVAAFVLVDVVATNLAWILAYLLRFEGLGRFIPVTKGVPGLSRYLLLLPLLSLLWPALLYIHGVFELKGCRSLLDQFFGVLFSVLIACSLTLGASIYTPLY